MFFYFFPASEFKNFIETFGAKRVTEKGNIFFFTRIDQLPVSAVRWLHQVDFLYFLNINWEYYFLIVSNMFNSI